jgi:flagellar biosynthesis/type III secretory pathway ATPase
MNIILHCPLSQPENLVPLVEKALEDGVFLIACVGEGCREVEDLIDDIIIGDGARQERFLATTSHPGESFEDVYAFASMFGERRAEVREVRL